MVRSVNEALYPKTPGLGVSYHTRKLEAMTMVKTKKGSKIRVDFNTYTVHGMNEAVGLYVYCADSNMWIHGP